MKHTWSFSVLGSTAGCTDPFDDTLSLEDTQVLDGTIGKILREREIINI